MVLLIIAIILFFININLYIKKYFNEINNIFNYLMDLNSNDKLLIHLINYTSYYILLVPVF